MRIKGKLTARKPPKSKPSKTRLISSQRRDDAAVKASFLESTLLLFRDFYCCFFLSRYVLPWLEVLTTAPVLFNYGSLDLSTTVDLGLTSPNKGRSPATLRR